MSKIYNILISKILEEIIPASKISISKGNKIFGAAILKKEDLSTVVIGTNNEIVNPLFHGEIFTIYEYFSLNLNKKIKEVTKAMGWYAAAMIAGAPASLAKGVASFGNLVSNVMPMWLRKPFNIPPYRALELAPMLLKVPR